MAKLKQLKPKIDPEIEGMLTPLHPEEYAQLKTSIEEVGQEDPGIVWQETGILLDGHTRMKICNELGVEFRHKPMSFPDRESAIEWVWKRQLARRNLDKRDRDVLIAKRVWQLKQQKEAELCQSDTPSHQTPGTGDVVSQVATDLGVSKSTAHRAVAEVDSNFCERCRRTKMPIRNCPKCAELQAKPKKKRKSKPDTKGSALIDWAAFKSSFGIVTRLSDRVYQHYPKLLETGERQGYERLISELHKKWTAWEKRITGGGK